MAEAKEAIQKDTGVDMEIVSVNLYKDNSVKSLIAKIVEDERHIKFLVNAPGTIGQHPLDFWVCRFGSRRTEMNIVY